MSEPIFTPQTFDQTLTLTIAACMAKMGVTELRISTADLEAVARDFEITEEIGVSTGRKVIVVRKANVRDDIPGHYQSEARRIMARFDLDGSK